MTEARDRSVSLVDAAKQAAHIDGVIEQALPTQQPSSRDRWFVRFGVVAVGAMAVLIALLHRTGSPRSSRGSQGTTLARDAVEATNEEPLELSKPRIVLRDGAIVRASVGQARSFHIERGDALVDGDAVTRLWAISTPHVDVVYMNARFGVYVERAQTRIIVRRGTVVVTAGNGSVTVLGAAESIAVPRRKSRTESLSLARAGQQRDRSHPVKARRKPIGPEGMAASEESSSDEALPTPQASVRELYLQAEHAMRAKQHATAIRLLLEIRRRPGTGVTKALLDLARLYERLGQKKRAIAVYRDFIARAGRPMAPQAKRALCRLSPDEPICLLR